MFGNKLKVGMTLAFRPTASKVLAGIPAHVINVWPPFHSGDYLVTLEFEKPVRYGKDLIRHIDAFASELYQPGETRAALAVRHAA